MVPGAPRILPLATPRGRPRNVTRRNAIVRAALRLFADQGFAGTTMREIAGACDIGETLVYRYYARKVDVLDAVVEYVLHQMQGAHDALLLTARRSRLPRQFLACAGIIYLHHVEELEAWYVARLSVLPLDLGQRSRLAAADAALPNVIAAYLRACDCLRDAGVIAAAFTDAILNHVLMAKREALSDEQLRRTFLDELVDALLLGAGCTKAP